MLRTEPIKLDQRLSRRLWRRYTFALFSIVVLIAAHHLISVRSLDIADQDEELINLSGKQRMLSQRTLMFAYRFLQTDQPVYAAETQATVAEFAKAHEQLILASEDDVELMELYRPGAPDGLDGQVNTFVLNTLGLLSSPDDPEAMRRYFHQIDTLGRDMLLKRLDQAVSGFETRANVRADWLRNVQRIAFISSLIILAAELLFIFLPLHQWILQTLTRLNREANQDTLTGLNNRKGFAEQLENLTHEQKPDNALAVLAMDLDGFKAVNDALGHPAGDELLRLIGNLLEEQASCFADKAAPVLARMGGDEFMLACLLPKVCAIEAIEIFGEQVLSSLQKPITLTVGGDPVTCMVGMSIGFSLEEDAQGSIERLVSNADIALYASKNSGKGRLTAFRHELRVVAEKRLHLETDIRRGVMNGEFKPYFQPQIDLTSGTLAGFELLTWWEHPEKGLLKLDHFVSDAEHMGLLDMIEASIILTGLEAIRCFRDEGLAVPRVSLNTSAQTLRDSEFVSNLLATVKMFDLPTSAIGLEIKEGTLIVDEHDPAAQSIKRLSEAGFETVIDDFGAGYASLNAVSGLKLHGAKIDESLVACAGHTSGLRILRASIAMAKSMGLSVCAAGVETAQHQAMLLDMGCDFAQGSLVGEAMDHAATRAFLEREADLARASGMPTGS